MQLMSRGHYASKNVTISCSPVVFLQWTVTPLPEFEGQPEPGNLFLPHVFTEPQLCPSKGLTTWAGVQVLASLLAGTLLTYVSSHDNHTCFIRLLRTKYECLQMASSSAWWTGRAQWRSFFCHLYYSYDSYYYRKKQATLQVNKIIPSISSNY